MVLLLHSDVTQAVYTSARVYDSTTIIFPDMLGQQSIHWESVRSCLPLRQRASRRPSRL